MTTNDQLSHAIDLFAVLIIIAYGFVVVAIRLHNDSPSVRAGLQPEARMVFPLFLLALASVAWLCAGLLNG